MVGYCTSRQSIFMTHRQVEILLTIEISGHIPLALRHGMMFCYLPDHEMRVLSTDSGGFLFPF